MKKALLAVLIPGALLLVSETKAGTGIRSSVTGSMHSSRETTSYFESQYYYLPEIDLYYDIVNRWYIYFERNRWVYNSELPAMYRGYNLARGYKVLINEYKPYLHASEYREQYRNYYNNYNRRSQDNSGEQLYEKDNHTNERNLQRNNSDGGMRYNQPDERYRNNSNPNIDRNGSLNNNRPGFRSPQNNSGTEGLNNNRQDERVHTEIDRDEEQNRVPNGTSSIDPRRSQQNNNRSDRSNSNNTTDNAQQGSSLNNANEIKEDTKEDKHNAPVNNGNGTGGQLNVAPAPPKEIITIPPPNNSNTEKKGATDDEQRAQFYKSGPMKGSRDALRNPKFNINAMPDSIHIAPNNTTIHKGNEKDSLPNGGQIKRMSDQQQTKKDSLRNDHIVQTNSNADRSFTVSSR
jgi:hypothetical protein